MKNIEKIMYSVASVFLITSTAAGAMFVAQLLLAWNLTKESMGTFKLLIVIVSTGFVRFLGRRGVGNYNWRDGCVFVLLISFVVSAFLCIAAGSFYHLPTNMVLFAFILTVCTVGINLYSAVLLSCQRYVLSTLLKESYRVLFLLFVLMLLSASGLFLNPVFAVLAIAYSLGFLLSLVISLSRIPVGEKPIPKGAYVDGLFFLLLNLVLISLMSLDSLVIAKVLPRRELGVYGVVQILMRGFDFAFFSLSRVLISHYSSSRVTGGYKTLSYIVLIASVMLIGYLLLGEKLLNYLFKGRYDEGAYLIPLFTVAGVIRIIYTFPLSIVSAKGGRRDMGRLTLAGLIASGAMALSSYFLVTTLGLSGGVISAIVGWSSLTIAAFFIMWRVKIVEREREKQNIVFQEDI